MSTLRNAILSGTMATALSCGTALGMGETYSRTVDQSLPMACPGGTVEERYAESGNIHGFTNDYALGCMLDANHAAWVIRSGLSCYDSAESPKPGHSPCDNVLVRALPTFNKSGDFWDQQVSPYSMRYTFIKYALGSNCQKVDQPLHREPKQAPPGDSNASVWVCEKLSVYDGTLNASGATEDNPRLFHTKELATISSKKMEPIQDEPAQNPMLDFVVPESEYSCKIDYWYFSGKPQLVCE